MMDGISLGYFNDLCTFYPDQIDDNSSTQISLDTSHDGGNSRRSSTVSSS